MNRGLLATREELSQLRERTGHSPFDSIYEALCRRCALVLAAKPITETDWRTHHAQGTWGSALSAARSCQGRIFDLIICHHIDPNTAYRDRAVEELKSLVKWSTWQDPCYPTDKADLCVAECSATVAVGLDWLSEDLSEVDRLRCLHALREKAVTPYIEAVAESAWWYTCYHNWNAVVNSGCGLGALALADEDPHAAEAVRKARKGLKHFFDALGREGGWDEGIGYWGYAMRYLLLFGEAVDRQCADRSIFRQRGMESTGLFGVYFSPRGHSTSFGDSPTVPLYGTLYALAKRYGLKEVCWWLDRHGLHRDASTTGWSDAGLSLLFRPVDMKSELMPDLAPVKVFNEIGWAAICDQWPDPGLYASVKTGDLSANHSHLDMNSIQIQVDGETLLADLGNPPFSPAYFSPRKFTFYEAQAQAHNTLIVGKADQQIDGQGQIVEAQEGDNYRWVAANAGSALGENVRFNRHVLMLVASPRKAGHAIIVLDEITTALPEEVQAHWHTFGKLALSDHAGTIVGLQSGLHFRVGANVAVACKQEAHKLGSLTESVLRITCKATTRLVLVTAFSREPVGKISLSVTSRGNVTLKCAGTKIHFKGSRRHLKLDGVQATT